MNLFTIVYAVIVGLLFSLVVVFEDLISTDYLVMASVVMIITGLVLKIRARGYLFDRRRNKNVSWSYGRRSTDYHAVDEYYAKHMRDAWPQTKHDQ